MKESPGARLRKVRMNRKDNKKSGTAVARHLEISPQYYYDIEKGKRRLTTEIAAQLSDYFEVTVDYLIGVSDVNNYHADKNRVAESADEYKTSPDPHEESELAEIPIEKLNQYKLIYKGHELSKEEADDITDLLEAALKRWKK